MNNRILVVDDEKDIQDMLCYVFEREGYESRASGRGDQALDICVNWNPDIVILDIGLPGLSGLEVCPKLSKMGIPVLVLSSHDRDDQVVAGLELGAEDYVKKPFNYKELLLRVEKIIRRTQSYEASRVIEAGDIRIDLKCNIVEVKGKMVHMTPTEFHILALLARNIGTPFSTKALLKEVWHSSEWINGEEMVKVNIRRLRKKIEEDPNNPQYLINRWGVGYFLSCTPSENENI